MKVANNQNKVMYMSTQMFKFLDICNYISPGTSCEKWVKTCGGQALKIMAAAIEWFDCANKLDYDGLPPYHCWFSKLKNEFVLSPEQYDDCQRVFLEWKIGTFADWLEYYNNVDVEPFLKAVESMRDFDTLLGVSMKYLVWGTLNQKGTPELYAPGEEAYEMLKDAVVGGLSLVFCRKHKVGKRESVRTNSKL